MLGPVKDHIGLQSPGVYSIPCECSKKYIDQIIHMVLDRCTEHYRHLKLMQPHKLAGHTIKFGSARILDWVNGYWAYILYKDAQQPAQQGHGLRNEQGLGPSLQKVGRNESIKHGVTRVVSGPRSGVDVAQAGRRLSTDWPSQYDT